MKDWPFWGWIAYGCLAIAAYGMAFWTFVEKHPHMIDLFPTYLRSYLWGYAPATLVSIGTIILIILWIKDRRTTVEEKAPKIVPHTSTSTSVPMSANQKKFYSQRNKSDLANALTDLSEMLIKDGYVIIKKAQEIIKSRNKGHMGINIQNIDILIDKVNEIGSLAANFYKSLYNDNGFIRKHAVYSDELCPILQIHKIPSNTPNEPITKLHEGINAYRNVLTSIHYAKKYND